MGLESIADTYHLHMWVTFAVILGGLALYAMERVPIEVTSVGLLCVMLVFFSLFPVTAADGTDLLSPERFLSGFANPALITVLALLVVGTGLVRTGVLERGGRLVVKLGRGNALLSLTIALVTVVAVSAFLNNIPVVVIFIPIMQMLAEKLGRHESKMMMGLSFAAVIGGMTTLIGSGTNLLVSGAMVEAGHEPFDFFEFTVPGMVMAGVGLLYILFVLPHLLKARESLATRILERGQKYFIAEIKVTEGSSLIGTHATGGVLHGLKDARVRMISREQDVLVPPFHDFEIQAGDTVVIAAPRKVLAQALSQDPDMLMPDTGLEPPKSVDEAQGQTSKVAERLLVEVMVTPASRLVDHRLHQIAFQHRTGCTVLGIQRRSHMFRSQLADISLQAGDVLLIQGDPDSVNSLHGDPDFVVMEKSAQELHAVRGAKRSATIFAGVVLIAATGMLPVVVAAMLGAVSMIATGALNIRQATRALDTKIVTMIPAALAMGAALQETGGAAFLADGLITVLNLTSPVSVLSAFFILTAIVTNVISAKACAVLFAPIGFDMAAHVGVDPHIFAVALVFAANCAFATPMGYQTNILVMGPGHYKFTDFLRGGVPLILILWVTFTLFAPMYFGL